MMDRRIEVKVVPPRDDILTEFVLCQPISVEMSVLEEGKIIRQVKCCLLIKQLWRYPNELMSSWETSNLGNKPAFKVRGDFCRGRGKEVVSTIFYCFNDTKEGKIDDGSILDKLEKAGFFIDSRCDASDSSAVV